MSREQITFLENIGINTRFVSILDKHIFINDLKFSKFSRKKEDIFNRRFPEINVVRSKIFQKTSRKTSRNLAHSLRPKEKIFLVKGSDYRDFALNIILEPYTRKYGIEITCGDDMEAAEDLKADTIALPLTLDDEVENILNLILGGKKIKLISSKKAQKNIKLIYPLLNVPRSWICSWLLKLDFECVYPQDHGFPEDLLRFFGEFIPDVRGNILKSTLFVVGDH